MYGLVFACMELSDIEQAQKHFGRVLETEAQEDLRDLAKNELREIAARELKARGQYGLDINDPPESHVLRGAAEEGFLSAAAHPHHVCRLQEDRAGDGYRLDLSHFISPSGWKTGMNTLHVDDLSKRPATLKLRHY